MVTDLRHCMRVAERFHCLKKGTNLGRGRENVPCVEETEGSLQSATSSGRAAEVQALVSSLWLPETGPKGMAWNCVGEGDLGWLIGKSFSPKMVVEH